MSQNTRLLVRVVHLRIAAIGRAVSANEAARCRRSTRLLKLGLDALLASVGGLCGAAHELLVRQLCVRRERRARQQVGGASVATGNVWRVSVRACLVDPPREARVRRLDDVFGVQAVQRRLGRGARERTLQRAAVESAGERARNAGARAP